MDKRNTIKTWSGNRIHLKKKYYSVNQKSKVEEDKKHNGQNIL